MFKPSCAVVRARLRKVFVVSVEFWLVVAICVEVVFPSLGQTFLVSGTLSVWLISLDSIWSRNFLQRSSWRVGNHPCLLPENPARV